MKDKIANLQRINDLYNKSLESNNGNIPSFLNIIRKSYHENYVSRIVEYALNNDSTLLSELIKQYVETFSIQKIGQSFEIVNSVCEQLMDGRRADIFLIIKDELENKYTLTIENKVDTWEHDDQTIFYYEWVSKKYSDYTNIFYYLKPDYNSSIPACSKYITISYSELNKYLTKNDYIIEDLSKHIDTYLGVTTMNFDSYEKEILDNYITYKNMITKTEKDFIAFQESLIEEINGKLKDKPIDYHLDNDTIEKDHYFFEKINSDCGIGSYRIYKKKWYKEKTHYFFVEIKFENGLPYNITVQSTLRKYSSISDAQIRDFIEYAYETAIQFNSFYVFKNTQNLSSDEWMKDDWKVDFINKTYITIEEYLEYVEILYNKWNEWEKEKGVYIES